MLTTARGSSPSIESASAGSTFSSTPPGSASEAASRICPQSISTFSSAINLRGLFLVTQAAIPLLRETRGWIVNLASIAGTLPTPGLATYGATKAAVISLTRSLNGELDDDGIRAIAICPGFVDTPMAQWSGIEPDDMIRPEDCAEVVRMALRLSPHARVPQVVIERMGSTNGDVPG